jgi:hypothetical protein
MKRILLATHCKDSELTQAFSTREISLSFAPPSIKYADIQLPLNFFDTLPERSPYREFTHQSHFL